MHLRTKILGFLFISIAIANTTLGLSHKLTHTQHLHRNQNQSDLGADLELGRGPVDPSHGNVAGNDTGTDSTEEGSDDYEMETGGNENGTEIFIFLCSNKTNANETIEKVTNATKIRVPLWLRAPMEEYKMEVISPNFALPLFNFRVKEGHQLGTRGCGHPNGAKRYRVLLNETHRKTHFVHAMTGELTEYDSIEVKSAHWTDYFTHKGYFKEKNIYYHPQHYCIRTMTDTELELDLCPPQEGVDLIVNKCCPLGSVIRTNPYIQPFYGTVCAETVTEWEPIVSKDDGENEEIHPYYKHVIIPCENVHDGIIPNENLPIQGISRADIQLQRTGKVVSRASGNHKWDRPKYDSIRYIESVCIDGLIADPLYHPDEFEEKSWSSGGRNASENADTDTDYLEGADSKSNDTNEEEGEWEDLEYIFSHENQIVLFCPNETTINEAKQQQIFAVVYFILYCIATPFHLVTFLVYLLVARRQNVHGWTTAGFSCASLINSLSITVSHGAIGFQHSDIILFRSNFCVIVAIINHFGYIAQFSWMTVLNFDLWLTISSMVPMMGRSRGFKRFVGYCAFGFGVPTVVVVTSVILEANYGLFDDRVIRPQYGHVSCNIDDSAYFHLKLLPTLILYVFNVLFIALTCRSLYRFKKDTLRVKSNSKSSRSQTRLFGKMFILMGVSWASDIISGWFVGQELRVYFTIFDMWNIVQSILLFWIFVCKKEIKDHLCMSYKPIQYVWDLLEGKQSKGKHAPSSSFIGTSSQGGETQNTSVSRMQSIRLARLRSLR